MDWQRGVAVGDDAGQCAQVGRIGGQLHGESAAVVAEFGENPGAGQVGEVPGNLVMMP